MVTHSGVTSLLSQPERLLTRQGGPLTLRVAVRMAATTSSRLPLQYKAFQILTQLRRVQLCMIQML